MLVMAYLPVVCPAATLIIVIVGILFSTHHVDVRLSDLQRYMDARFDAERRINEANFKVLLEKIGDMGTPR
jgi:hypothetical protein